MKNIHGLRRQAISSLAYDAMPNALASNRAPLDLQATSGHRITGVICADRSDGESYPAVTR
jgi:hypothetical protein